MVEANRRVERVRAGVKPAVGGRDRRVEAVRARATDRGADRALSVRRRQDGNHPARIEQQPRAPAARKAVAMNRREARRRELGMNAVARQLNRIAVGRGALVRLPRAVEQAAAAAGERGEKEVAVLTAAPPFRSRGSG
jgi:hypothetical protein